MAINGARKSLNLRNLVILAVVSSFWVPVVIWVVLTWNYASLDRLSRKYECDPVDKCSFDLNSDGAFDRIEISIEPTHDDPYYARLKLYVSEGIAQPDLNIEKVHVDGTFRTHLAYLEENGIKKIVVYDTVNPVQFFYWDGSKLSPSSQPSELERRVREAMTLGDDTGGFNQRIFFELSLAAFCFAYYFVLILVITIYLFWRRSTRSREI